MNCGPKALVYLRELVGKPITLARARELCQTNSSGTIHENLEDGLQKAGFTTQTLEDLTWDNLLTYQDSWYIIMSIFSFLSGDKENSAAAGHYVVGVDFTPTRARVYDSEYERIITLPRPSLEAMWFDFEEPEKDVFKDWINSAILVRKEPLSILFNSVKNLAQKSGTPSGLKKAWIKRHAETQTVYHGTSEDAATYIRAHGFDTEDRPIGLSSQTNKKFTFVSPIKPAAQYFADVYTGRRHGPVVTAQLNGKVLHLDKVLEDNEAFGEVSHRLGVTRPEEDMFDYDKITDALKKGGYSGFSFKDKVGSRRLAYAVIPSTLKVVK